MPVRFDTMRKMTGALLATLLIFALLVPACMTIACTDAPMAGDGMMGGMSISECLDAATAHDGLLASDGSSRTAAVSLLAMLGAVLITAFFAPLTASAWVLAPDAVRPPPPTDPRGVRLLL